MLNKTLIITLGITGLSSVLLFLYFRNKLNDVEEKIETMFQVIQNYDNKESQISLTEGSIPPEILHQMQQQERDMIHQQMQQHMVEQEDNNSISNPNNELITVSDKNSDSDESESDTDDSDESESDTYESDIEEEKQLKVNNTDENLEVTANDVEELNDLNLTSENNTENNTQENNTLEDVDKELHEDSEEDEEEDSKKIVVDEMKELRDLKVTELKRLCRDKGLSGYKNLRKNDLIELLNNN